MPIQINPSQRTYMIQTQQHLFTFFFSFYMNILFIDNLEPNPLLGGISRVISCLASSLKENYGFVVSHAAEKFDNIER